jgi:membrane protein implicated in regulation of membrane protease activity
MSKFKIVLSSILAFGVIGGVLWLFYKSIALCYHAFASLNPNVAVAIVAGSTTVLASTLAVVLTRYYQSKQERKMAHRDRKIELYDEFVKKLFDVFLGDTEKETKSEDLVPFLREIQRKLVLWSGPGAIKAYAEWHKVLTTKPPRASHMIKMIDFFLALREDLGHSNKGIEHSHMVRFLLRNSDLFMQEYRRNPNVTFAEIAALEEKLGLSSDLKGQPIIG